MLHMQKFQQQQIHYMAALLSKETQLYSKEKLRILLEVQLNLRQFENYEYERFTLLGQGPQVN